MVLAPINTATVYPGGYAQAGQAAAPYATAPYAAGAYGTAMPGAPAMPGVPQAPGVQKGSSNKVLWVIFGILLALVIVLAAVLTTMFLSKNNAESTDSTTSSASAQPGKDGEGANEPGDSDKASSTDKGKDKDSADSKDEDSAKAKDKAKDTAKPSPKETLAPAPSDAQHSNRLTTKTGNMTCSIQRADMWCTVKDQNGGIAGCHEDQSITVVLGDSGGPVSSCTSKSDYAAQGNVLEYDQTITSGDFACTSDTEGTTCWNTVTDSSWLARTTMRCKNPDSGRFGGPVRGSVGALRGRSRCSVLPVAQCLGPNRRHECRSHSASASSRLLGFGPFRPFPAPPETLAPNPPQNLGLVSARNRWVLDAKVRGRNYNDTERNGKALWQIGKSLIRGNPPTTTLPRLRPSPPRSVVPPVAVRFRLNGVARARTKARVLVPTSAGPVVAPVSCRSFPPPPNRPIKPRLSKLRVCPM